MVDEAEGADWADGADRADETDVTDMAEIALHIKALFYFYCLGHKELKNIALGAVAATVGWMDGTDGQSDHTP